MLSLLDLGPLCFEGGAQYVCHMYVTAFSSPRRPEWRWRITDGAGQIIEESRRGFGSIAAAVAAGTGRLVSLNIVDHTPAPPRPWRVRTDRNGQHV